jgi:hypothetical protein
MSEYFALYYTGAPFQLFSPAHLIAIESITSPGWQFFDLSHAGATRQSPLVVLYSYYEKILSERQRSESSPSQCYSSQLRSMVLKTSMPRRRPSAFPPAPAGRHRVLPADPARRSITS